jgi:ABC-2 type transport system ATP-binding protein
VRLELADLHPIEAFAGFGVIEAHQGHQVRLLVPRAQLTERVAVLLERFAVVDLEVSDPPIEELIGGLFRQRGDASVAGVVAAGGGP